MWQKPAKKTIFTLYIGDHSPEVRAITFPFLEQYAAKIGANIHVIDQRKFPEWPITYEKFQIYELAQEMGNDWNLYIDSDALIHPDCPDFTLLLPRDTVCHHGQDFAPIRWRYDRFFQRDGRHIGSGNWFTLASDWCIELWKPIDDLNLEEVLANIQPTVQEKLSGVIEEHHLIDDYTCSRNIAKYGLKFISIRTLMEKYGYQQGGPFFYHAYTIAPSLKAAEMRKQLALWGYKEVDANISPAVVEAEKIQGWMGRQDLEWLYAMAQQMESVVEVGSWVGRSTYALLAGAMEYKDPEYVPGLYGTVYAVDHWEGASQQLPLIVSGLKPYEEFVKNVGHFKNLVVLKMSSEEAAKGFPSEVGYMDSKGQPCPLPEQVDMVFLDAEHEYPAVLKDLKLWLPKTRKIICGHDWAFETVRRAVLEVFPAEKVKLTAPGDIWYVEMG